MVLWDPASRTRRVRNQHAGQRRVLVEERSAAPVIKITGMAKISRNSVTEWRYELKILTVKKGSALLLCSLQIMLKKSIDECSNDNGFRIVLFQDFAQFFVDGAKTPSQSWSPETAAMAVSVPSERVKLEQSLKRFVYRCDLTHNNTIQSIHRIEREVITPHNRIKFLNEASVKEESQSTS